MRFLRSRFSHGRQERSPIPAAAFLHRPEGTKPRCYTRKAPGSGSNVRARTSERERRNMNGSRGRPDDRHTLAPGARRRVVVTGMGAVSPNGIGLARFDEALRAGRSGVAAIRSFDPSPYATRIGAEIPDFDPAAVLTDPHDLRHVPRASALLLAASDEALATAGLAPAALTLEERRRFGVSIGTGGGGFAFTERMYDLWYAGDAK